MSNKFCDLRHPTKIEVLVPCGVYSRLQNHCSSDNPIGRKSRVWRHPKGAKNLTAHVTQPGSLRVRKSVRGCVNSIYFDPGVSFDLRSRLHWRSNVIEGGDLHWVSTLRGRWVFDEDQTQRRLIEGGIGPQITRLSGKNRYWIGTGIGFESNGTGMGQQSLLFAALGMTSQSVLTPNDRTLFQVRSARIKPSDDPVLETNQLGRPLYSRWDMEARYQVNVGSDWLRSIEFGYRHYQRDLPMINTSTLERNRLGTVRLDLPKQFYLQYAQGSQPLDLYQGRNRSAVSFGWNTALR